MLCTHDPRTAYISTLFYAVGETCPISRSLGEEDPRPAAALRAMGFRDFTQFTGPIDALAARPIAQLFEADTSLSNGIGAVIIAQQKAPIDIVPLLRSHGVRDVPVFEMGGMQCANLAMCIAHASMLVSSSIYDNVLCCFATKTEMPADRLLGDGIAFVGDGAACCVVSANGGVMEVRNSAMATSLEIYEVGPSPSHPTLYLDLSLQVYEAIMAARDRRPFDHMIAANFPFTNNLFLRRAAPGCGMLFSDNVSKYAHVGSGDVVINLKDKLDQGARGDFLMVGVAPHSICMIDLVTRNIA